MVQIKYSAKQESFINVEDDQVLSKEITDMNRYLKKVINQME